MWVYIERKQECWKAQRTVAHRLWGLEHVSLMVNKGRPRWFGDDADLVKCCMAIEADGITERKSEEDSQEDYEKFWSVGRGCKGSEEVENIGVKYWGLAHGPFLSSPLPSHPLPSPSLLSLLSPPLRSRAPQIQLGVLGERCKLPQRGLGRRHSRNQIWCILALKSVIWWQQF